MTSFCFSQVNALTAHAAFVIYPLLTGINAHSEFYSNTHTISLLHLFYINLEFLWLLPTFSLSFPSSSSSFTKPWPCPSFFIVPPPPLLLFSLHPSVALGWSCDWKAPASLCHSTTVNTPSEHTDYTESWTRAHKIMKRTCTHVRRCQSQTAAKLLHTKPTGL